MTRKELESLGMTDEQLAERARALFDVDLGFVNVPDTEEIGRLRQIWFDQVRIRDSGSVHTNPDLPPARSFAQDNPDVHFARKGKK